MLEDNVFFFIWVLSASMLMGLLLGVLAVDPRRGGFTPAVAFLGDASQSVLKMIRTASACL